MYKDMANVSYRMKIYIYVANVPHRMETKFVMYSMISTRPGIV